MTIAEVIGLPSFKPEYEVVIRHIGEYSTQEYIGKCEDIPAHLLSHELAGCFLSTLGIYIMTLGEMGGRYPNTYILL